MPNPLISNVKIVKKNIILGAPTRKGSLRRSWKALSRVRFKTRGSKAGSNRSHWLGFWQERQGHWRRSSESVWEPRREIGSPNLASPKSLEETCQPRQRHRVGKRKMQREKAKPEKKRRQWGKNGRESVVL